uniref:lactosylceramide alpha-2,3-sialyltransferase n=1 Tax=Myxine glutinosa TaxID=7769 RepID=UPI00358E51E2
MEIKMSRGRVVKLLTALSIAALLYTSLQRPKEAVEVVIEPELVKVLHKLALSSLQQTCRLGFARTSMAKLFSHSYNPALLPFVWKNLSNIKWEPAQQYHPPFGFRGNLDILRDIMELLPETGIPVHSKSCQRCIVIGNGGILRGLGFGTFIDGHDVIIRLNDAPVKGFEFDVGKKTSIRIIYPESALFFADQYDPDTIVAAIMYKDVDFKWLEAVIQNKKLSLWTRMWFWRSVPQNLSLPLTNIRVVNLLVVNETAIGLLKFTAPSMVSSSIKKNVPTLGLIAITLATHFCDEVNFAGFGYDFERPSMRLHYYDKKQMEYMKYQLKHDVGREVVFLRDLVTKGVIKDLTGGVNPPKLVH